MEKKKGKREDKEREFKILFMRIKKWTKSLHKGYYKLFKYNLESENILGLGKAFKNRASVFSILKDVLDAW